MKTKFMRAFTLCMALILCLSTIPAAYAAEVADTTIDESRTGSLTIFKYDVTSSEKDGVWDSSYVSTGVYDQTGVNDILGGSNSSTLGNGDTAFGYAIPGVEFTYVRIADIVQFSESEKDNSTSNHVEVLYAIDQAKGAAFLKAIGLEHGLNRYINADFLDSSKYYYQSDVLINALAAALENNSTAVKNALERYVAANGGTAMPLTDAYGKTGAENMELGLYLVCETKLPEYVVSSCNPFLASVPMTSVNGTNATDGGTRWIYDIVLYPKNLTGIPSLEKTLREQIADTGKNGGSATDSTDGYAHTGTASDGDVIDYQILSTLPSITSEATYLTTYTFVDTLSAGLSYNKGDVVLEFFTDAECTDRITTWKESDGKFTVSYASTDDGESVMTIEMTSRGLAEINTAATVYTGSTMVNSGYSDCTLRITYQATMDSDNSVVYGDSGNPNEVVLMWQRSTSGYYDTLVDDCHLYTYGIDLTKLFSDGKGDFANVEFIVHNDTDNYFLKAELNEDEGIYYVVDHVEAEADATHFIPVTSNGTEGKVIIKGMVDQWKAVGEIQKQLTDPVQVERIYQEMMLPLWESTVEDFRYYEQRKSGIEAVQAYRNGTFSVFGRPHTLEPLSAMTQKVDVLKESKSLINAYCQEEFDQDAEYSDLTHVDLAFGATSDSAHQVEIFADLIAFRLVYQVDKQTVHALPRGLAREKNDLAELTRQLENAKAELETPFSREEELTEKEKRLKELNILLNMDEKDNALIDDGPDEGETQAKVRSYER